MFVKHFSIRLDKFHYQMENNQKTINLLEQNFRITKHELDLAKQN